MQVIYNDGDFPAREPVDAFTISSSFHFVDLVDLMVGKFESLIKSDKSVPMSSCILCQQNERGLALALSDLQVNIHKCSLIQRPQWNEQSQPRP